MEVMNRRCTQVITLVMLISSEISGNDGFKTFFPIESKSIIIFLIHITLSIFKFSQLFKFTSKFNAYRHFTTYWMRLFTDAWVNNIYIPFFNLRNKDSSSYNHIILQL